MKKVFLTMALLGAFALAYQPAQASCNCAVPQRVQTYTNTVAYETVTKPEPTFSLNPFTGFKNCNPCKVKKQKCAKIKPCPTCQKAYAPQPACPCRR